MKAGQSFLRIALAYILSIAASLAHAVCLNPDDPNTYYHPTVKQEVESADAVIVGFVVEVRALSEDPNGPGGWTAFLYTIRPTRVVIGQVQEKIIIRAENDSGGYRGVKEGSSHLLFLEKRNGYYSVDPCGNSGELPETNSTLRELMKLKGESAHAA